MLNKGITVQADVENSYSIRITGGKALDNRTLVCQVSGNQLDDEEVEFDRNLIVIAINHYLAHHLKN